MWQGYQKYIGLIDCGADINCIGEELIKHLKYKWLSRGAVSIRGIGGGVTTNRIIEVKFNLQTGDEVLQSFAVMKKS